MMGDSESQSVARFLHALAAVHETLSRFSWFLSQNPRVGSVKTFSFAPSHTSTELSGCASFGVSACLRDRSIVDWWIDVDWNQDGWNIEYSVYRSGADEDGSHRIVEFAPKRAASLDELITHLQTAVVELTAVTEPLPDAARHSL